MIELKRGANFIAEVEYVPSGNDVADLSTVTITSQVRTKTGLLIDDVTITKDTGNMSFTCSVADTSAWPVGVLLWDIKFVVDTVVTFTETVEMLIEANITMPPVEEV